MACTISWAAGSAPVAPHTNAFPSRPSSVKTRSATNSHCRAQSSPPAGAGSACADRYGAITHARTSVIFMAGTSLAPQHADRLAGQVLGLRGGEEDDDAGDVLGLREAAGRDHRGGGLELLGGH